MKYSILLLIVLSAVGVYPAISVSRWFSATFYDLRFTLRRYGHCTGDLYPVRDYSLNETEYLIYQIKTFLDQGNYDAEQLSNVTSLMDNICRSDIDQSYPISVHIDVNKFSNNHTEGKANRCQAIDDALDSMFYVFRRAALNRSEPLDFSVIQFYPNATDKSAFYNLTDLINTSWIKSETILEHVCNITDSVKRYVQSRVQAAANSTSAPVLSNSGSTTTAEKRNENQARTGVLTNLFDMIDRLLDPILGLQKRLMWESNNRLEMIQHSVSSGLGSIGRGFGNRIKSTRDFLTGGPRVNNSTIVKTVASFNSSQKLNSTSTSAPLTNFNSTFATTSRVVSTTVPPTASAPRSAGKPTSSSQSQLVTNAIN